MTLESLKNAPHVTGLKQVGKIVSNDTATMAEIGKACAIEVGAAAAAILK